MNDETVVPDRLSIPLQTSLERLDKDSRITLRNLGGTGFMLLSTVFLFYLVIHAHAATLIAAVMIALLVALSARSAWMKITCARKLLQLYDGAGVPVFTMDARGITCPLAAMNYRACRQYLETGENSAQVRWDDMDLFWEKENSSARNAQIPGMYMIRTKAKDNAQKPKVILMERNDFSTGEQDKITYFAQRFLPFPITRT